MKQFKLPDVGEGLTEAEIVSWKVKPGDTVKVNEIIVEIETAKSLVELPCPFAGVVSDLLVDEGTTVDVGTPIITVDDGSGAAPAPSRDDAAPPRDDMAPPVPADESAIGTPAEDQAVEPGLIGGPAPGGRTSVLVGYGPRTTSAIRRPRKGGTGATPAAASAAAAQQAVQTSMMTTPTPVREPELEHVAESAPAHTVGDSAGGNGARVLAKPPVRKLAKDLGVDLSTVVPSGEGGVVTRSDVEAAAGGAAQPGSEAAPAATYRPEPGVRETRVPVKGVRKMTAAAMVGSAFTAPHVTEWVTVDVTRTMELVERLKADRDFRDVKVSPLLVLMKALLLAVRRNPEVNASWDEAAQEIVVKHYVNLGIAAATPRGLVVPNIKDADRMSLRELAEALGALVDTARAGRTQPAEMAGGTITITNVGVFGVDSGTPIINPGESAILCFGQVRPMPWVVDGELAVRQVTQLSLSFDHRLIDGQLGSMFLADIARVLDDPATALLW
ncbi:MAG TPA: dihydrolipoamide acetyltransferase family protein [Actinomycetes bacterium]|nr:dihydrolipoamide acetyltransferase family protein [Actinomycetes bacterium]